MDSEPKMENLNKGYSLRRYQMMKKNIAVSLGRSFIPVIKANKGSEERRLLAKSAQSVIRRATARTFREGVQGNYDRLTGLVEKNEFKRRLESEMERAYREKSSLAILLIDLDGFKTLNDSYGHTTGDHVLRLVADEMKKSVRHYDTVGRVGGDEFAIAIPFTPEDVPDKLAQRIDNVLTTNPNNIVGLNLIAASIGVAVLDHHEQQIGIDEFIDRADIAMYNAKLIKGTHVERWRSGMERPKQASSR